MYTFDEFEGNYLLGCFFFYTMFVISMMIRGGGEKDRGKDFRGELN